MSVYLGENGVYCSLWQAVTWLKGLFITEHWLNKHHAFAVETFFKNNYSVTIIQCVFGHHVIISRNVHGSNVLNVFKLCPPPSNLTVKFLPFKRFLNLVLKSMRSLLFVVIG